jgi:hypothetical protein
LALLQEKSDDEYPHKYGNTTSTTLPLLLADYEDQLKKKGDNLILQLWWRFHIGSYHEIELLNS